jgi:hypothetical protein
VFHKTWGFSTLAEKALPSQEGLCSMELAGKITFVAAFEIEQKF